MKNTIFIYFLSTVFFKIFICSIFESSIKNERDDSDNSSYYFESESSTTHNTEEILDNGI